MADIASTERRGPGVLRLVGLISLGVVVLFIAIDIVLRVALRPEFVAREVVSIQSPATLYAKLEALRGFEGRKVVVLGDSLVFGRTMRDFGDADWQSHTLPAQLESRLATASPHEPVMVVNLGMNGVLPNDLDQLIRIVCGLEPDLVLFDLTLRSFSRDFESDTESVTRAWLGQMDVSADGRYATGTSLLQPAERVRDLAVNYWHFYRMRDFLQSYLFDEQPVHAVRRIRDRLDALFKGVEYSQAAQPADEFEVLLLLMKAKARYAAIDLATDNPQVQALQRALTRLRAARIPSIAFYATENPAQLEELIERPRYEELLAQLAGVISSASPDTTYVGPLAIYEPANFLDHVHLDSEGYRRLADHLAPLAAAALAQRP